MIYQSLYSPQKPFVLKVQQQGLKELSKLTNAQGGHRIIS